MNKSTILGIFLLPFAVFSQQAPKKTFTEKLEGITTSKKELTKNASTDNSSIGQGGVMTNSIPLVTVSSRTMSFPIQLQYASGIKVDQQSGPVGLGWVLPVGSIKRDFGAYYPDYSSTYHEADMYNTVDQGSGTHTHKGMFATTNGTTVNPFANHQYLGFDAIEKDAGRLQPLSDLYHISVPGKLSNSFFNSAMINAPHLWKFTEREMWKIAHTVKTYQIAQEFSRINEINLERDQNNAMTKPSSYAAAIGVLPYVKNGFAKIPSGFSVSFNPNEAERYVRYEDFEQFTITDENGTRYVFGRALRGQRFVYSDDPYWSNKQALDAENPAQGNFWKIDYIAEWLLTEIQSVDYVDSNNNKIADDGDAGDWIRFEYTEATKTEEAFLGGDCYWYSQEVPKYREWSSYSQTDRASSLMRELAYLQKIVTPTQEIDFTISERYDVNHDYYTKPANRVGNDYYYENRKLCSHSSTSDFDINYPVETMRYDSIKIKSRLVDPKLYPNENLQAGLIKFNYAAKGSAQELAVSSFLIRNNDKQEKSIGGTLIGAPGSSTPFNLANYSNETDKRGKTTLLGVEFYGTTVSAAQKSEYKFEYGYNPSFDEFHKREILRAYYFPSVRQGSIGVNPSIPYSKADGLIDSYSQIVYNSSGGSTTTSHSGISPYEFLINFPYRESYYKFNASDAEKMAYANDGKTNLEYGLISNQINKPILPIQDVYGYFYIPGYTASANAWSLTKITYPTGGEVSFEYEPASFTPTSSNWNLNTNYFPIISEYNGLASMRSYIQDAHNVSNAQTYANLGLSPKKLTATFEMDLYTNYGIRLKKKTTNDRINPAVVISYQYGTGTFTAMPAEFVQSLISGFNQFISRENKRHSVENTRYFTSNFAYDFQEKMSQLSHTNIALDDYAATNFYESIRMIQSDGSSIKKIYGPSFGNSIDFPVYNLFCYKLPSAAWQGGYVLGGDNVNRVPISLKSEEFYEANAVSPYQKTDYEYTRLMGGGGTPLSFKYDLGIGSNNTVELWSDTFEVYKPDGTNGINTYKAINGLYVNSSFTIGENTPSLHSYQKWGESKTVMTKETTNYKGIVTEVYYTYAYLTRDYTSYPDQLGSYVLRETRKQTVGEGTSYISRNEYAIETYFSSSSKFRDLNLVALPTKKTLYLNAVHLNNALSAQVITYDLVPAIPKALDTYQYETDVDPVTGTFTLPAFNTSDPKWRISETDIYEYNPAAMPVSTRSNRLYTKTVTGNRMSTVKASIVGTERPFDATYTGFEDLTDLQLIGDWNDTSYLKEDWYTTEAMGADLVTKITLSDNVPPCTSNSSFAASQSTLYHVITTNDVTNIKADDVVDFSYTSGGSTTTVPSTIAVIYPTADYPNILMDDPSALNYVVCFQTAPLPNISLTVTSSKITYQQAVPRLTDTYARTGKYSYKLSSIRANGSAPRKTPVRPVHIAPLSIATECNVPEGPGGGGEQNRNPNVPASCYWDYQASLWIKYDTDAPVLPAPDAPAIIPFSDDAIADAIYRRGTVNTTNDQGVRIVCRVWNNTKTAVREEFIFYPQDLNIAWQQFTVDFSIFKGYEQWMEVFVENNRNQVGQPVSTYRAAFVDDIIIAPKDSRYEYAIADALGQQTFKVNNNDVFVQSTYDAKGRATTSRNAYGRITQELSYFDQPNWTMSENYVTEVKWLSNVLFNTTRYFMDGFGRTKQVQASDHVRNLRMVSETSIYNDKGQIVRAYKPYYLNQYGLAGKHDATYAAKTQVLYGSDYAFTDVTFEPKPEPVVSTVSAPRSNSESAITSSQTEYMNPTALNHVSTSGMNTFPAGTLLVHQTVNPVGKITRTYLNRLGQVIMEEHQIGMDHTQNTDGSISFNTYDLGFAQTWFYYDGAGRIVATYDPENKKSEYFYNSLGVMVKSISPDKGTSELRYDQYGQVRFIRNQKDIDAATTNSYNTSQFKYIKYDVWGQTTESGVVTVAPNNLGVSTTSPPFPTGDFFNDYTKINDQNYPKNTDKFVQIHVKNEFTGTRKFYNSTVATKQVTYSGHLLNTSTFSYSPAKTDEVSSTYMADGQVAKTSYLYDGLPGTHVIMAVYNALNLPVGKDYIHPTNALANFKWRSEIDQFGRVLTSSNVFNNTTTQVAKNYYDPLGNLLITGFGATGVSNNPHIDYLSIKKNIRDQVVSQVSKNYRFGLTYDAAGNITNQYWNNGQFDPVSASSTVINQYAYTYDKMNRLIGADYKQSTMTSNPFLYYSTLNAAIPADFNCTLDGEVVSAVFNPFYAEFQDNITNNIQVNRSRMSSDVLKQLQSDYMINNVQYSDMSNGDQTRFLTGFLANCKTNKLDAKEFEMYMAVKRSDNAHVNYLNANPLSVTSLKYTKVLLGSIPWSQPVNCVPNPAATAYSYLPNFPAPVAASNSTKYDAAYWYQENGNFYSLNRNDDAGVKTQQLYGYQSNTNKLTQASFQVGTGTPTTYSYTYDANGNILTDPKNQQMNFVYSLFDELPTRMVNESNQQNYRYFGGARSVKEISDSQREYYVDMLILDQSGTVKSYQTAAGYAIPNGTTASYYYQVKDWLGTAHVTLDAAGAIKNAMDYYPYGKKLPGRNSFSTNQEGYRYQFTGHEMDGETGYQYHGARYYNEELARYMSVDRYAMKFFNQSPYVYAGAMPVNRIDINGDYSEEVAKGMAERGGDNGYTTKVVANPNKEGDFGVNYIKTVKGIKYEGVQFDGKFEGIVKGGLKKLSSYQKSAAAGFADGISPGISEGKVTAILGVSRMVEAAKSIGSSFSQDPTGNTFVYNSIKSLVWDYSVLGVNSRLKSANSSYEKGKVWGDLFYTVGTTIAPMAAESNAFKSTPTSGTQVFRAVDATESAIIKSKGEFSLQPGGVEAKYFARSLEDANWYGQKLYPNGYSIVKGTVVAPVNPAQYWYPHVDIGVYVFPRETLPYIIPQ